MHTRNLKALVAEIFIYIYCVRFVLAMLVVPAMGKCGESVKSFCISMTQSHILFGLLVTRRIHFDDTCLFRTNQFIRIRFMEG
jgi:hypothetical protein